jgi:REP element-mobilizing transposase RayT
MCSTRKITYRRRLPHIQPPGQTFAVTFRLTGSLPDHVVGELMEWRDRIKAEAQKAPSQAERLKILSQLDLRYWGHFDEVLNTALDGPTWLRRTDVADLVAEAIHYRDGAEYELDAYCIMPNHVHLLIGVQRFNTCLNAILQSLKAYTARKCNTLLTRQGPFWHHESYDHVIRDGPELDRVVRYIIKNPVAAGLCKNWEDWTWTYVKDGILEMSPGC